MRILIGMFMVLQFVFISGCSPFGGNSVVDMISKTITNMLGEKQPALSTGSTQYAETAPNDAAKNFKVTYSMGDPISMGHTDMVNGFKVDAVNIK